MKVILNESRHEKGAQMNERVWFGQCSGVGAALRRVLVGIAVIALVLNLQSTSAAAAVTATVCDNTPKYWCMQVDYTTLTGGASANVRNIKGAYDGGAYRWRGYIVNDWTWSSANGWTLSKAWPAQAWQYNQYMTEANMYSVVESRAMYAPDIAVVLVAQFEERTPTGPGGAWQYYVWCSPQVDVHIYQSVYNQPHATPYC